MNSDKLFEAIGLLNDDIVKEAREDSNAKTFTDSSIVVVPATVTATESSKRTKLSWQFMPMVAALLVLAIGTGLMFHFLAPDDSSVTEPGGNTATAIHDTTPHIWRIMNSPPLEFYQPVTQQQAQEYLEKTNGLISWRAPSDVFFIEENEVVTLRHDTDPSESYPQWIELEEAVEVYVFNVGILNDYDWDKDIYFERPWIVAISKEHGLIFEASNLSTSLAPDNSWDLTGAMLPKGKTTDGAKLEVFNATSTGLSFMFRNSTDNSYDYGEYYWVWERVGNKWQPLEAIGDAVFILPAYPIAPNIQTVPKQVNWEWLFGELPTGEYMFAQTLWANEDPTKHKWAQTFTVGVQNEEVTTTAETTIALPKPGDCAICDNPLSSFICEKHMSDDQTLLHGYQLCSEQRVAQDPETMLFSIVDDNGNRFIDVDFIKITKHKDDSARANGMTTYIGERDGGYEYHFNRHANDEQDSWSWIVFNSVRVNAELFGNSNDEQIVLYNHTGSAPDEFPFVDIAEVEDFIMLADKAVEFLHSLDNDFDETVSQHGITVSESLERFWNRNIYLRMIDKISVANQHGCCPNVCNDYETSYTPHVSISALFDTPSNGNDSGYWELGFSFERNNDGEWEISCTWIDLQDARQMYILFPERL
jgi:hypothetical protein